ncbi:MAG TPA: YkgJ family cysteine cluster protein [Candidatus Limnocylindrales bacterium]|nr:YkgJ family cysteine cluster protein [Candidatus Limnocylindrales bacterium]
MLEGLAGKLIFRLTYSKPNNGAKPEDICLACGLCCDGVIFADVKLQSSDDPMPLLALGSPLKANRSENPRAVKSGADPNVVSTKSQVAYFPQPCFAFDGCQCRIYPQRPQYCREFECLLLKSVRAGKTERARALEVIGTAKRRANLVWRLLRELGDVDEDSPLSVRFRRTTKRLENSALDEETAARYGELTLAVHDLNFLLSDAFYPK